MRITIVKGQESRQLSSRPTFNFALLTNKLSGLTARAIGNQIVVKPAITDDVYSSRGDTYISTINGVSPNNDGEFFIDGSDCTSWGYILDGQDTIFVPAETTSFTRGISLVDLCPACKTCESLYRLQYEVENLKMWINTLKDVNLYEQAYMNQRRTNLRSFCVSPATDSNTCAVNLTQDDSYMQLQSVQLLQQYMTVVHMWNYVVSENNSSNLIEIAPEDTTGFVVKTKRALPSCNGSRKIRCTITVSDPVAINDTNTIVSLPSNYPISIYVPETPNVSILQNENAVKSLDLHFEPFDNKQTEALSGATMHIEAGATSSSKIVRTDIIDAKVAGTYIVSVKFLPFIYYQIWKLDENGNKVYISVRGGTTMAITPNVSDPTKTTWDFGISGHTWSALAMPTQAQYIQAKTAPTCSVNFKLIWPITIKWEVITTGSESPEIHTENYNYMANGIRVYYGDKVITQAEIDNPPPEDDDEEEDTTTQESTT